MQIMKCIYMYIVCCTLKSKLLILLTKTICVISYLNGFFCDIEIDSLLFYEHFTLLQNYWDILPIQSFDSSSN